MLVLDASTAVRILLDDEGASVLGDGAAIPGAALVPPNWVAEVVAALARAVRDRRLSEADAGAVLRLLREAGVEVVDDREPRSSLLAMALATGLTAQDAAYLLLAVEAGAPLATEDAALRRAAERIGVPCL
jgi:predicted nucleic acid-binding protein